MWLRCVASKTTLTLRRSSRGRCRSSRAAGLVICKPHGMAPLVERHDVPLRICAPAFEDGSAFLFGRRLFADPTELEIQLQSVAYDRRAAAFPAFCLAVDERAYLFG